MAKRSGGFRPGMGGGMQNMMQQAQRMQANIARVQEELEEKEVEASAGGGVVSAVVSVSYTHLDVYKRQTRYSIGTAKNMC